MMRNWLMSLLLILAACATGGASLPPLAEAPPGPYRLGAGDEIRVTVFGLDAANNSYMVGDAGTISVALLGPVAVAGQTVPEVEATLAAALREKELIRAPSVNVQIQKYRPFFILGEVQKPGQYPYVPGMSVLTAVSIAGGFTFRAASDKAEIVRNQDGRVSKGRAKPESLVLPGDTIKISEAWF